MHFDNDTLIKAINSRTFAILLPDYNAVRVKMR